MLHINEACTECWQSMMPNDTGKYCPVCRKDIFDFRSLTDNEIIDILSHAEGKVCGRFLKSQLDRPLVYKEGVKLRNPRCQKIIAALLLASSATVSSLNAQTSDSVTERIVVEKRQNTQSDQSIQEKLPTDTVSNIFSGTIVEEGTKEPVIGASVVIKGTTVGVVSDLDGKFTLTVPDEILRNSEAVTFVISLVGYEPLQYKANRTDLLKNKTFELELSNAMLGEIIIIKDFSDPIYNSKRKR
ncbi:MAG: carboxypeptidase-like regulatory domain-containing protein [Dysgonomonas sp.]